MENRKSLRSGIPLLLLLLIFLLSIAILLQIFAASWVMSRRATDKNCAVQICRNAAEAFSENGDARKTAALLGAADFPLYFDESLCFTADSQAPYRLELEVAGEQMVTAQFSVYSGDLCLYSLTTQVYREVTP